jgi:hypothetical protein
MDWQDNSKFLSANPYVHCRKIYNSFVRALETGRKASLLRAFVACFAASVNTFYI